MKKTRPLPYIVCNLILLSCLAALPIIAQLTDQQMSITLNMRYGLIVLPFLLLIGILVTTSHRLEAENATGLMMIVELAKALILVGLIVFPYGRRDLVSIDLVCLAISITNFFFAFQSHRKEKTT